MTTSHERPGARGRVPLPLLAAIVAVALATPAAVAGQGPGERVPGDEAGARAFVAEIADLDWELRDLGGRVFSLAELRGRTLFVNLWATWCAPCVAELASIERLAERVEGAGLDVVFLLVSPEDAEVVRRFARRRGLERAVYLEETRIPDGWGMQAIPTTWIVDPAGRVVFRRRGAAEWDRAAVVELLRAATAVAPATPAGPAARP